MVSGYVGLPGHITRQVDGGGCFENRRSASLGTGTAIPQISFQTAKDFHDCEMLNEPRQAHVNGVFVFGTRARGRRGQWGTRQPYVSMWVGGLYFSTRSTPSIRRNVSSGSSSRSTTLCCDYAALKAHSRQHMLSTNLLAHQHTRCENTRARAVHTPLHTPLLCPHGLVSWHVLCWTEPSQATPPRPSSTEKKGAMERRGRR